MECAIRESDTIPQIICAMHGSSVGFEIKLLNLFYSKSYKKSIITNQAQYWDIYKKPWIKNQLCLLSWSIVLKIMELGRFQIFNLIQRNLFIILIKQIQTLWRNTKNDRALFQEFIRQKVPDFKSPRGLTGVRFHEQIQDCECVYEIATFVPDYLEATDCASLARSDYQKMSKNPAFHYLLVDLLAIIILNAHIFDPLYRVGIAPGLRFF